MATPLKITRMLTRTAVVAATATGLMLPSIAPAHAAAYSVGIGVGGNGASAGYVSYAGTSYRVELVASGSGTCTLTNAPVVIGGVGAGMNSASVAGAPCTIYDGQATYEMVYYAVGSLLPIGGWYRECTWALGIKTCSVEGTSLPL